MKPGSLLPHSQELAASCPYPEPKSDSREMVRNMVKSLRCGVVSTSPSPQARGPPLAGFPRLLIQYIRSCSPYRVRDGTRWRHCATSRKVAGSIPYMGIVIVFSRSPSDRTMALASTQTLAESNTRVISWGGSKDGWCVGLRTLQP